jgi:hypothetical protein
MTPGGTMNSFESDMRELDEGISALKIEYNRYFTGALERPPFDLQASLERIVRRHASPVHGRRTAEQFRYNSLVSQFRVLTELWNRNVRNIEEGRPSVLQKREEEAPTRPADAGKAEREVYRGAVSTNDPGSGNRTLQELYQSYVQTTGNNGNKSVSYESFHKQIQSRVESYQARTGTRKVVLRIVLVDNRPVLKLGSAP